MALGWWATSPLLRGPISAAALRAADLARRAALESYPLFLRSAKSPPELLDAVSPVAAWRSAEHAQRRVPAYRAYLRQHGWWDRPDRSPAERLASLPITDKQRYVRAFSTEERCLDGRIPLRGTQIDESSGSSGIPYNWVRGAAELKDKQRPCVHVEVLAGSTEDAELARRLWQRIVERLTAVNLDFRASLAEDARAAEIQVRLHEVGRGPFAGNSGRIKRRYIVGGSPDTLSPTANDNGRAVGAMSGRWVR